ncbi:hypothetical protein BC832DRAFT_47561 [Gaertneriomyces semiglobifer]|nr:hypothetical protein BC832DRAFT_47561 [Gaertneriomyces semiglobifer]
MIPVQAQTPVTPNKPSPFSRFGKKSSTAQLLVPSPNSPVGLHPNNTRSTLGALEVLPHPILFKVLRVCAPELASIRRLSRGWRDLVDKYIERRTKRFQDSIEESECWGHRAPAISDIVGLDPLVVAGVLEKCYAGRLAAAGDPIGGTSEVGVSEIGVDELAVDDPDGDEERVQKRPANTGARPIRRDAFQEMVFEGLETALERYEDGTWATVSVLREFIIKYGLQYTEEHAVNKDMDIPRKKGSAGGGVADDADSERDVADTGSVRNLRFRIPSLTLNVDSIPIPGSRHHTGKEPGWLRLNDQLYRLASFHGHAFNLPALSDLMEPQQTIAESVDLAVRGGQPSALVSCLDASRIGGCFYQALDKGYTAALSFSRTTRRTPIDVLLVLLDATFNDPLGPWALCAGTRGFAYDAVEERGAIRAQDLLWKAEECVRMHGIGWHRLGSTGMWAVVPCDEVAREIRSRVKIVA